MGVLEKLHSCAELMEYIKKVVFLPLLPLGIRGWSAEEVMGEDCLYVKLPDGGYEWPLWDWFTQPKMLSKFDTYVSRLQMGGYIVTEDFLSTRQAWQTIWLWMVIAQYPGELVWQRGLSYRLPTRGVEAETRGSSEQDYTRLQ